MFRHQHPLFHASRGSNRASSPNNNGVSTLRATLPNATKGYMMIRFSRMARQPKREITKRRIAAAVRHLAKEREKAGLFAAEVAAEQPTPIERIQRHDDGMIQGWTERRVAHAQFWREARSLLKELPDSDRCLAAWNACGHPGDAVSFLGFVRRWPQRREHLDRPFSAEELAILARLSGEWLCVFDLSSQLRLACADLIERGLCEKGISADGYIQIRHPVKTACDRSPRPEALSAPGCPAKRDPSD